MREMKPLILPKLVAARKSSKSSLDITMDPPSSSSNVFSSGDSGFYSMTECSTPPTPCHSSRGHLRYPSSTSSLSSSPPAHEPFEPPNGSGKLPKLTEEPVEREDDYEYVAARANRCSYEIEYCDNARSSTEPSIFGQPYDFTHDYFNNVPDSPMSKRRRSVDSSAHSFANRIESRFPSLSRKAKDRKRSSTLSKVTRSATPSRAPSTRVPSTRSSSITSSIHQAQGIDPSERFPATPTLSSRVNSRERLHESFSSSRIDVAKANALGVDGDGDSDQVDAERFATTPLLPPMLVTACVEDAPTESPLQSPTVADPSQSLVTTPIDTPPFRAYPTPPLSSKPSTSSFKASRSAYIAPPSDIPPMMLSHENDKWAALLSHANFTIQPEPYVPDVCDAASLRQLFADWERARCNFTKHLVRTGEHHGVTSKVYWLTEEKWAETDASWKANNDLAISRAAAMGEQPAPTAPVEPAPLTKMPLLNDPKSEGKFPKLGDEDIVGPMVQIASPIPQSPSRKRAFFKFFSDIKFPGSFLGKSTGYRGR